MSKPECFGKYLGGSVQALRDCDRCPVVTDCMADSCGMPRVSTATSDGSTASYYELPEGATQLQDLISHRDMNSQLGEIFRACYRYGTVEHSPKLRDIKKIIFYAEAEKSRLEKLEGK